MSRVNCETLRLLKYCDQYIAFFPELIDLGKYYSCIRYKQNVHFTQVVTNINKQIQRINIPRRLQFTFEYLDGGILNN